MAKLKSRILICALSCMKYAARRSACLSTWAGQDYADVDIVFVIGNPTLKLPIRDKEILYVPCDDGYDYLPSKVKWMCLWAMANCDFEYLFKCDDDTYVALDRLMSYKANKPYIGHNIGGYASGGAGYLLNNDAVLSVASRLTEQTGYEDVLVQRAVSASGLPFVGDNLFHPWNDLYPTKSNNLITGHYCSPKNLINIHRLLK